MKRVFTGFVLLTGLTFALALSSAAQQNDQANSSVVAKVGKTNLTTNDFEKQEAGSLLQARYEMYKAERKVLDQFIEDELLELQAKSQGMTVQNFLDTVVYKGIKDPTDDQLEVYYEGLDMDQPFSTLRQQILDHVREMRRARARYAYVKNLKTQANIRILLQPPTAEVNTDGANVRGSKNAPVVMVEFADYECPYCVKVNPVLQSIEKEYGSNLAVIYKDFPLPMHKESQKAAEAARCAGDQGKFWEYHDLLFSSHQLDVPSLKKYAGDMKLDQAKFDTCLDSGAETAAVQKDLQEGQRLGLTGTPSFFINGHFISGAADSATLHEVLGMQMPATSNASTPAAGSTAAVAQAAPLPRK